MIEPRPRGRRAAAGLVLAALLAAAPPGARATEYDTLRWQVPMAFGSGLPALGDTMPWVADRLRAVSGGAIDLQVVEPGTVIPPLQVFASVSQGAVDAGYSWMGYEWGEVPAAALFGATPFGLESVEFLAWFHFRGGRALLEEIYAPFNVMPLSCGTISPEGAGWFRGEIEGPDDLEGLSLRAAGIGGEILGEFGAALTMLPGGALYEAFAAGRIEALEFSVPAVDEVLGFQRVASHYYLPGWHQPSTNQFLYVNLEAWEALNDQTRAAIELACMAGNAHAIARAEAEQAAALARIEAAGVTVAAFDEATLRAFHAASERVIARRAEADADFARVHASMMDFQREHARWKELGYLPRDWLRRQIEDAAR